MMSDAARRSPNCPSPAPNRGFALRSRFENRALDHHARFIHHEQIDLDAWLCVELVTLPSTAKCVRNAFIALCVVPIPARYPAKPRRIARTADFHSFRPSQ